MNRRKRIQQLVAGVITCLVAAWSTGLGVSADAAPVHAAIASSGSSWAANAVDVWDGMAYKEGLQVSFTAVGSAQGRKDFANYANDFAVSDIGYQGHDPVSGAADSSARPYAYLPIVAGGTSFPYQIRVRGQLVRTLRLSGETLAKIFTLQITNWNDPQITRDNNGHTLPSLPIIPVVHSEGSGSSYQFTRYLATQYPSIWNSKNHPGPTEYFVRQGSMVAENGSDSMINFITSRAANGAIGYDEYSYALGQSYPVAKVLNSAGYFTLPNQYNVAVALTKAIINMDKNSPDYLLQNLSNVYANPDPRTYPVSSYSYGVIPTSANDQKMSTAKRQTMADYLFLSICQGQRPMGPFGYSPLPINLVQAGFAQIAKLHAADSSVVLTNRNVSTCNNPTFIPGQPTRNYLAEIAPQPASCDKVGAGPCTGTVDTGLQNPVNGHAPAPQGNSSLGPGTTTGPGGTATGPGGNAVGPGATGANGAGPGSTGAGPGGTGSTSAAAAAAAAAGPHIDPNTGQLVSGSTSAAAANGQSPAVNASTLSNANSPAVEYTLGIIAAVLLLGALIAPPLVAHNTRRRQDAP
jgi:ABC-type phosphate transport system substrate-binding protein